MTSSSASPEVLIVAAEASSALYALRLLEHWRRSGTAVRAFGIGSREMEAAGFEILGRSEELAVVGVQEVLAHWKEIRGAFNSLLEQARQRKPQVAILLDYPDFNLRLAKKLKALGVPVVYYISPQVWAWRQGRVNIIRRVVDKMLVLFPFEADFYSRHQVPVEFVGHPLLDELNPDLFARETQERQRARYGVQPADVVLALMPGSRHSELKHHLGVQIAAAERLSREISNLKVMLLVAPTFSAEEMRASLPHTDLPLIVVKAEPFSMISLADVVLCASGTATLMVGLMQKPMVIMYRMNPLTAWLARRFVRATSHFGLINLVLGRGVVPELFQEQASVDGICQSLRPMLTDAGLRAAMTKELQEAATRLGSRGATERVARVVEAMWSRT